jgi:hypothetical protein
MTKNIILTTCVALTTTLAFQKAEVQYMVDVGFGASTMDRAFTNVTYRYQINNNFRVDLEAHNSHLQNTVL